MFQLGSIEFRFSFHSSRFRKFTQPAMRISCYCLSRNFHFLYPTLHYASHPTECSLSTLHFYHQHSNHQHFERIKHNFLITHKFDKRKLRISIRRLMTPGFSNLFNQQFSRWLAGNLLLGIYNHLDNVPGLDFRLLHTRLVAKELSAVEPSLRKHVDILLSLFGR